MSITDQIQKVRLEFQSDLESLSSENGTVNENVFAAAIELPFKSFTPVDSVAVY